MKTYDVYLRWLEYAVLTNVQEMELLHHDCTHIADWVELTTNKRTTTRVILKQIVDGPNAQPSDFDQVNYLRVNDVMY